MTAPISGRPCVAFVLVVDRITDAMDRTVRRSAGGARFAIDDGTGRALVDPAGACILVAIVRAVAPARTRL